MTAKRLAHDGFATGVDAVNLEDIFRQIQTNASDLHDGSPSTGLTADRNPPPGGRGPYHWRPVVKGRFEAVVNVSGAVMSSAFDAEN
jgi:hypothetical protein